MKTSTPIYLVLLVFAFCSSCKEQSNTDQAKETPAAETKTVAAHGGPNSITRAIIQNRKGDIWMATWEGVFRYDARQPVGQGTTFTNMTTGVSDARFFSALEDSKGDLWFGTIGSGVYRYDGVNFTNFTTKDGLPNNEVTWIYEDKAGHIWFGVNGGASRYDARLPNGQGTSFRNYLIEGDMMVEDTTGKTIPDLTRPPMEVNAIMEDSSGKLWFATRGRTYVYDGKTFLVFMHADKPFTNVRTVIEDSKGQIWFGGNDGLWRYSNNTLTQISKDFCGYIYEDSKGNIWTSSETGKGWALSRYDAMALAGLKPTPTVINPWKDGNPGLAFGILEANDGSIWFGTTTGVYRYDGANFTDFMGNGERK
ncbi:MAG: two-component regulator propeller domain-containing protein [Imperialibacter sp.]|uniref:ligand-binding sensor domain-containing protein n=1 Tax=Imperialibacter sp. TaxID=2038411 RepID=UPI0032F01041